MKRTIARSFTVAAIPVLAIFLTCGKGNNNPTGPSGTKVNDYTIGYHASGDSLSITTSQYIYSSKYCIGDSLISYSDTSQANTSITVYELTGNTLRLLNSTMDTLPTSGAVIRYYSELTRVGNGTGLIGIWKYTGESYNVISGMLQPAEVDSLDAMEAMDDSMLVSMVAEYQFTGSQINLYMSGSSDYASEFINYEWDYSYLDPTYADSALYNVTIKKVSENKLTLTGNVTHEVVTIQWVSSGAPSYIQENFTETFTSSTNVAHPVHTYYSNPQTCPDDNYPAWWQDFLTANQKIGLLKSLPKQRAHKTQQIRNPLFPRSLLFVK
jgi:hypothetical protein